MDKINEVANKGTGAGGANTNLYGKSFEEKTSYEYKLLEQGFVQTSITNKTKTIIIYVKNLKTKPFYL